MILDQNLVKSLMDQISKLEIEFGNTYQIDNKNVPRVTEILSAMLHNDSLLSWANNLGWKRISYKAFMKDAADKGTYSHLAIENYLKDGYVDLTKLGPISEQIKIVVQSCIDGFLKWWNDLHENHTNIEIVFIEESLIHEYFGGTCDCLLKVDGKYYLLDFKTSNHMSYNYALQLAAYRFLFRELKNINIDKCGILMLSKVDHTYKTYELDLSIPEHLQYINECEQAFMSLAAAYRMRMYTTDKYYKIFNVEKFD